MVETSAERAGASNLTKYKLGYPRRDMTDKAAALRQQILDLTRQFHAEAFPLKTFAPGTTVPVSGKVIDGNDIAAVVDSALDGWFTTGRWAKDFEKKLAKFFGLRSASLVNSGSSAS